MKVLAPVLFLFLLTAISWMDFRITGHLHAALLFPAGLITVAFSFVKEKKSSLLVLSALIVILSFAKRNTGSQENGGKQFAPVAAALAGR